MILRRRSSLESFHSLVWLAIVVTLGTTQPPASGTRTLPLKRFPPMPVELSGLMIMPCHPNDTSRKQWVLAALFSIMTMMVGWMSTS